MCLSLPYSGGTFAPPMANAYFQALDIEIRE